VERSAGRVRRSATKERRVTIEAMTAARVLQAGRGRQQPSTPADLARRLDPKFVVTPTIRLLSDIAVRAVQEPDCRDIVTTPPRTGNSRLLAVWTVVWALMNNPDLQIVLVSYSDERNCSTPNPTSGVTPTCPLSPRPACPTCCAAPPASR
jgi:hypothetical protein